MTSASHSNATHGWPPKVNEKGSVRGTARWSRIQLPAAICQLTSPSLKIIGELANDTDSNRSASSTIRSTDRVLSVVSCPPVTALLLDQPVVAAVLHADIGDQRAGDNERHIPI